MKTNLYSEPWKDFGKRYTYCTSPAIPSIQNLKHIEKYIKKIKTPKILILGCTANIREIIRKDNLPVTMVDINEVMYKANTEILKKKNKKEIFIFANWLTMNLKTKFDIILGDIVINNIPVNKKNTFYKNIKRHLKNDGYFITRTMNKPKKIIGIDFIKNYKKRKITRKAMTELWWDIVFQLSLKNEVMENKKGLDILKSKEYPSMKKWLDFYEKKLPTDKKEWVVLSDSKQKKELNQYFNIHEISYVNDYKYCEICPTYVLSIS